MEKLKCKVCGNENVGFMSSGNQWIHCRACGKITHVSDFEKREADSDNKEGDV